MTVAGETSACAMAKTPTVTAMSCSSASRADAAILHDRKYTVMRSATRAMKIARDCAAFVVPAEPHEGPIEEEATSAESTP